MAPGTSRIHENAKLSWTWQELHEQLQSRRVQFGTERGVCLEPCHKDVSVRLIVVNDKNARRVLTSLNLVVRGRKRARARNQRAAGATHKHRTSLDRAGSGCVPFFAASWKQRQAAGVVLPSLS